jgi:hypothetical protein
MNRPAGPFAPPSLVPRYVEGLLLVTDPCLCSDRRGESSWHDSLQPSACSSRRSLYKYEYDGFVLVYVHKIYLSGRSVTASECHGLNQWMQDWGTYLETWPTVVHMYFHRLVMPRFWLVKYDTTPYMIPSRWNHMDLKANLLPWMCIKSNNNFILRTAQEASTKLFPFHQVAR